MNLSVTLIVIILLFLAVLVILLVDALVNDSDAVIDAPGVGMDSGVSTGEREHVNAAPLLSQPATETQRPKPPKPEVDGLSLEASEQRLARNLRDPELRKIPLIIFSEIKQRSDGHPKIVLYERPPMPLYIPPVPEESIVEQINKILQIKIAGTPLAQRDICLIESPTKGVIVKIGPRSFDGIDAVTDPEVKAAVQAAVAEWEAQQ